MLKRLIGFREFRQTWHDTLLPLAVLVLMSYFYHGIRALFLCALCISAVVVCEFITLRLRSRKFTSDDLSCISDALIIAMMLPASVDWKIPFTACIFAVFAAKNLFGGRENMIFSPSAAAYIFMAVSWKDELLKYPEPYEKLGIFSIPTTLSESVSGFFNSTGKVNDGVFELLIGTVRGPMGAVGILLLIVSAMILLFRRRISAGAFLGTLFGAAFTAYLINLGESPLMAVRNHMITNMLLFGAIYIVSDRRTAPKSILFSCIYGLIIGISAVGLTEYSGIENAVIGITVLMTPVSLAFRNVEDKYVKGAECIEQN